MFNTEFKRTAVQRILTAEKTVAELSRELDIAPSVQAIEDGMRRGEVLGLTWERVDRARGVVLLDATKSGKRREVP